jgi:hypothetical protein
MRMLLAPAIAAATLAAAPPTLTHGQLVARADGICVRYAALLESPPGVEGRLGDADYDAAWLRLFARQRTELGRLGPPSQDRAAYARFLRTLPPVATSFRALADALEAGEPVKRWRPLFHRYRDAERAAGRAAWAVGLRRCFVQARSRPGS